MSGILFEKYTHIWKLNVIAVHSVRYEKVEDGTDQVILYSYWGLTVRLGQSSHWIMEPYIGCQVQILGKEKGLYCKSPLYVSDSGVFFELTA